MQGIACVLHFFQKLYQLFSITLHTLLELILLYFTLILFAYILASIQPTRLTKFCFHISIYGTSFNHLKSLQPSFAFHFYC
jgi:hypothetical protein